MTVVFSTYQSIDAVAQAQKLGAPGFDLVICDEAHRTTGATVAGTDESAFVRIHNDDYIHASKRPPSLARMSPLSSAYTTTTTSTPPSAST